MTSRRDFLQTLAGTTAAGIATGHALGQEPSATQTTPARFLDATPMHPPKPESGELAQQWNNKVSELVQIPAPNLDPGQIERHLLYCGLLSAIMVHYWNGNKRGQGGKYPWREKQLENGRYRGGDYFGHNIACLAVDAHGRVIDFDFNHNDLFSSSVEHAESRLVRRIFSLTQVHDAYATRNITQPFNPSNYSTLLNEVTIYTSLESCSQCSGIMALGSVKEVIYLQRDPGQASIGNILWNLGPKKGSIRPPLPIPADLLGFAGFAGLQAAYDDFRSKVKKQPFFVPSDASKPADTADSITSFLCNDAAFAVFNGAKEDFDKIVETKLPHYRPTGLDNLPLAESLSNQDLLAHLRSFHSYATRAGKRGTPHQL